MKFARFRPLRLVGTFWALMALSPLASAQLKVSVVSAAAATGTPTFTQDFTDATTFGGATPKAVIILGSTAVANDTATSAGVRQVVGFAAGSNSATMSHVDNVSANPNSAAYSSYNTKAYLLMQTGGTINGEATGAFIANGYRLSWTDQSSSELVKMILIGGTNIEAAVSTLTSNNGTSGQTVTHGLTGTPDFIIAINAGPVSNNTNGAGSVSPAMGFWTASSQLSLGTTLNAHNVATVTSGAIIDSTNAINQHAAGGGASTWIGAISAVGATTFTTTFNAAHTNTVYFLSVRSTTFPLAVKAGVYTTPAATGNQADVTGMATPPQAIISLLNFQTVLDTGTSTTNGSEFGVGVAVKNTGTSATQAATVISSDHDNAATSTGHGESMVSATNDVFLFSAGGNSSGIVASVNSWDSGGVTHNYSTVSGGTLRLIPYLAFGDGPLTPTFSVAPAIGTRTTSTIPVTATTACTDCSYSGVAVVDGSGAPTCTQVKAGNNSSGTAAYKAFGPVSMTTTVQNTGTFSTYTDGTVRDGYFCLNSTANGDSLVVSIADMYKIPAFTSSPVVSSQTDVAYTLAKTLDGPGTVFGVVCRKDQTAATVTQVEAGQCTGAASALASASANATASLVLGSALTSPVYDISVVGTYGSQHQAATVQLFDECLDAPTGKQYIGCPGGITSMAALSFCTDFNAVSATDIAVGDILNVDSSTSPAGFSISVGLDCILSYPGDASRQSINFDTWDLSTGAYIAGGPNTLWFNNRAPYLANTAQLIYVAPLNSALTPIDLTGVCLDDDGDAITYSNVDALPLNLAIVSNFLQGTLIQQGVFRDLTWRCADAPGDFLDFE